VGGQGIHVLFDGRRPVVKAIKLDATVERAFLESGCDETPGYLPIQTWGYPGGDLVMAVGN
jgi:hypothetical protein